jgi:hypothetical protein
MQSIYNQAILDKIKEFYPIEFKSFIGWSQEDIEFLEQKIAPSQIPTAIKDYLLWAGNGFDDFDFRVMSSLYVKDFYSFRPPWIQKEVKTVLGLELHQYVVFFYYCEGDFIIFSKLEDVNPNPPVYKTDYEVGATDLFVLYVPSFTDFIVNSVLMELRRIGKL